jgi:hypothetical protein
MMTGILFSLFRQLLGRQQKDGLCSFILAAAALGVHPAPQARAERTQSPAAKPLITDF